MMKSLRACLSITGILLALCCAIYPALVTAAAQAMFPSQANGSLLVQNGVTRGSSLIGQTFGDNAAWPEYFWGRPSAASADPATGVLYSSGSNYGPLNPALKDEVEARVKALRDTGVRGPIPVDLVTKSASGLDPHLSPAAVELQIPRVAKARGMSEAELRLVVAEHDAAPTLGFMGERRVNVLTLNLALDAKRPVAHEPPRAPAAAVGSATP
jgi:K+-transporting ATPase ATPase C chain